MNVKTLTATILGNMPDIGKWQSDFLQENFDLQCKMRGRHNFLGHIQKGKGLKPNILVN